MHTTATLHCCLHLYADLDNLDPFHKVLDIESCIIGEIEGFSTPNRFLDPIGDFPWGMGHRVENGWVLTKVAVVLLNGLIW